MLTTWASHADPSTPLDLGNINGFVHYQFFTDQSGWPLNAREMETALEFYAAIHLVLAEVCAARSRYLVSHHRPITGACQFLVAACTQPGSPFAYVPQTVPHPCLLDAELSFNIDGPSALVCAEYAAYAFTVKRW